MLSYKQISLEVQQMVAPEAMKSKMLPIGPEMVAKRLAAGKAFYEERDGKVVSFGTFDEMAECTEIRSIITRDEYRGQGLATKICQRVIMEAQKIGKPVVSLCNSESKNLMNKIGLRLTNKTTGFPQLWAECQSCPEHKRWPECHCQYMQLFGRIHEKEGRVFSIVDLSVVDDSDLTEAAKLYCDVWKEPPWCETEWTPDGVAADFRRGIAKDNGIALIAIYEGKIVGFTSGWSVGPEEIAEKTDSMLDISHFGGQAVYYIAELAADQNCRRAGIGKQLSLDLMAKARQNGAERFLLRTNVQALAARVLYQSLGFRETGIADGQFADRTYWVL